MARRPRRVYDVGTEPDYRFTLANERTFLAWIRTALALLAAGVALDSIDLSMADSIQRLLAAMLVVLGLACAVLSWFRWAASERALRQAAPLPSMAWVAFLPVAIAVVAIVVFVTGL